MLLNLHSIFFQAFSTYQNIIRTTNVGADPEPLERFLLSSTTDDETFNNLLEDATASQSFKTSLTEYNNLKQYFNRSFFFTGKRDVDAWFSLISHIGLRIQQFPATCLDVQEFLNHSVDLSIDKVQRIVSSAVPYNWLKSLYAILVRETLQKFVDRKFVLMDRDDHLKGNILTRLQNQVTNLEASKNKEMPSIFFKKLHRELQLSEARTMIELPILGALLVNCHLHWRRTVEGNICSFLAYYIIYHYLYFSRN